MTFLDLGLKEHILKSIEALGFQEPTPIQQKAIPVMLKSNKDFVGLAQTGTGKTAAYGLPLVQLADFQAKHIQSLVICPTRELCLQVADDIEKYTASDFDAKVVSVYGGADINKQIKSINKGAQVIVATPGRLVDLIKRKKVQLNKLDILVLDEADEMLNMGFKDDLDFVLSKSPQEKRVWLFSATMPKEVERIAKNYMSDPERVVVGEQNKAASNIEHQFFQVKESDRYIAMKRFIDLNPKMFGLIFCRTRRDTQKIADQLIKDGYNAASLHGDLSQSQRDQVMKQFRGHNIQLLVATDVAARGIDVNDVTHVIHHKLPDDVEGYTHRSGRTARAGNKGISLAIINTKENGKMKAIEKKSGVKFNKVHVPTPENIGKANLYSVIEKISNAEVKEKAIQPYMDEVLKAFENLSKEEMLKRWLTVELEQLFQYYENAGDLNAQKSGGKDAEKSNFKTKKKKGFSSDKDQDTLYISLGKKDGLNPGGLVRALCDQSGVESQSIGKIDIKNNFSFVDVEQGFGKPIEKKVGKFSYEDKNGTIEMKTSNGGSKKFGSKKKKFKKK